jgi:hypothetical protein
LLGVSNDIMRQLGQQTSTQNLDSTISSASDVTPPQSGAPREAEESQPFVVYELMKGGTLSQWIYGAHSSSSVDGQATAEHALSIGEALQVRSCADQRSAGKMWHVFMTLLPL